jgi:prolipoprotein diacylglyceryltransferase
MHVPVTITVFTQTFYLHQVLECVGMFVAFRYYKLLKRQQGDTLDSTRRLVMLIAAIFGAWTGAHVLGTLEDIPHWPPLNRLGLYFLGNQTVVGALLGGLLVVEITKWMIGERKSTGDLYTFPLILGMIIGRIGCFSAGVFEETYGIPTTLPWAMDLGDGVYRHPVTLYEIGFLTTLWVALAVVKRRAALQSGELYKLFLGAYLVFRFFLDFIKPGWRYFLGLGSIQIACLVGIGYYAGYWWRRVTNRVDD